MKKLFSLLACVLGLVANSSAQAPPEKQYVDVVPPKLLTTTDKVEVVEVFSYACIHCAHFQPLVDEWRKHIDAKKVEFTYLPSPYNPLYQLLARGYYTAASMGVAEKTHYEIFNAIHERGARIQSLDDLASVYAQLGVPRDKFLATANSFFVESQVRRALEMVVTYRADSTPSLIIAGKYRITADLAGGQENMLKVADQLIAKELAQSKSTSRQAPSNGK
ncbi:MAG TPA: thiol:disulfide interchange protein DsbA/DsbL [Steroidobacteraceae bacterium]|nr:thiol:disulfide interchange protein DsbA/DsbL [Steroidobacteraceae bacterium]